MTDRIPADRAFVCSECSNRWYYTRTHCPTCRSDSFETYRLETGRVLATTVVHATPPDVRRPNPLALVRFDGVALVAQLRSDAISAGDEVEFGEVEVLRTGGSITGPRLRVTESR